MEQVAVIYCGINGFFDDVAVSDVRETATKLRSYLKSSVPQFLTDVRTSQKLSPENEELLKKAVADVKAM